MLKKLQKNKSEGFTIIEVLIVLAIAGLILVVVFLAVPNLQRNTRNNSRKNDAARISTAASNFVSNNNGTLPTSAADAVTILNDAGTLGQYTLGTAGATTPTVGQLAVVSGAKAAPTGATLADNVVYIDTNTQCGTGGATIAGSSRQMSLVYTLETNGGWQAVCLNI